MRGASRGKKREEKPYKLQLQEFAARSARSLQELDPLLPDLLYLECGRAWARLGASWPSRLRALNDEMHRAYQHMSRELEEVWCLRPAPPFWPEPGEMGEACEDHEVGPWLDFEDMFLTSRVLMRALSELVGLLGALAGLLPEEETGGCRRRISGTAQAAGLREAAAAAAARRAPWLRASPCEAPTARQELVAPPLSEAQAALDRALWSEATALVRSSLKSRGRAARCIQRAFRARAAHRADGPAAPSPSGEAPSIPSSAGAARAPSDLGAARAATPLCESSASSDGAAFRSQHSWAGRSRSASLRAGTQTPATLDC